MDSWFVTTRLMGFNGRTSNSWLAINRRYAAGSVRFGHRLDSTVPPSDISGMATSGRQYPG